MKEHSLGSRIANALRAISIVKYNQGMFHQGRLQYSSVFGGVATLTLTSLLIIFSVFKFNAVFNHNVYRVETEVRDILSE